MNDMILWINNTMVECKLQGSNMSRRINHRYIVRKGCGHQSCIPIVHSLKLLGSAYPFSHTIIIFPNTIWPLGVRFVQRFRTFVGSMFTSALLVTYSPSFVFLCPFSRVCRSAHMIGVPLIGITEILLLNLVLTLSLLWVVLQDVLS